MAVIDFGTVRGFGGDEGFDLYFPLTQNGFKDAVKRQLKARWNPNRRCWSAVPKFSGTDAFGMAGRIEKMLYDAAPEDWRAAVGKFGGFACASKKYEVKVGAGGIRIRLPDGHPCDYLIKKKVPEAFFDRDAGVWLIPAFACGNSIISKVLTRIVAEDKDIFHRALEPYEERSIKGLLLTGERTPGDMGVIEGATLFGSHAFLSVTDPDIPDRPIHAWPFKVKTCAATEYGSEVRLAYMDAKDGYLAVRRRQAKPEDERDALLDLLNADEKWISKRG